MKRFITALGICVVLLAPVAAFAHNNRWSAGNGSIVWNDSGNWLGNGWAGDTASQDNATIDATQTTYWPEMRGDYTILSLTMRDGTSTSAATEIDTDDGTARTLTVSGDFAVVEGAINNGSYVEKHGTGTISAATVTITGGTDSGDDVTLEIVAGTVSTSGLFKITDSNAAAYAEVWVTSSGTLSPDSMELAGDARLTLDADVTVDNEFKITDGFDRPQAGGVDLATDVTLTVDCFTIDGATNGVTLSPTFASGSSIVTN